MLSSNFLRGQASFCHELPQCFSSLSGQASDASKERQDSLRKERSKYGRQEKTADTFTREPANTGLLLRPFPPSTLLLNL